MIKYGHKKELKDRLNKRSVARFLDLNNLSLIEMAIWIVERRKRVWATGFFLSASSCTGKSYMSFCSAVFAGQWFVEIQKFC